MHHRAPGPVLAFVENPGGWLEVINDGVHVRPEVIRMLCRLAPGRVALVSDAMAAAGAGTADTASAIWTSTSPRASRG